MTRSSPGQLSFSSGEISPLLAARQDYQRFQSGLAACSGFIPLRQGGFTRAPGTWFRGNTRENNLSFLVPFVFAADDAVVLEFTNLRMRVWRYGSLVTSGGSPYTLVTPYSVTDLRRLQWVQSADVMYLADGVHPVHKLSRFALSSWTIAEVNFQRGPFRLQNDDKSIVMTPAAAAGIGFVLSAVGNPFTADMVGSLIRLEPQDGGVVPQWAGNRAVSVGNLIRYGNNTYSLQAGTNTGANPPIHTEGDFVTDPVDGTTWRYVDDGVGIVRVTGFTHSNSVTVNSVKRIPRAVVDGGTYRWSLGAWSDKFGYPSTLEIHDQRLVAAATPTDPRTIWFSTVGAFEDFEPSTDADGSFAYAIAGKSSVNRILWLSAGKKGLHIGALGEEYSARTTGNSAVIGPTTAAFSIDSAIGSAEARPAAPDGNPLFISRDGTRIVELAYTFESDGVQPRELSLPAEHIGQIGFLDIAWQSAPLRLCWIRLTNGQLAVMVYDPSEDVLGWARHQVEGFVDSICVTPGADGGADTVTLSVSRTILGETVRHIEEFALIYGIQDDDVAPHEANHLMCAVRFTNPAQQRFFDIPHLGGREVYAWTNEGSFGPLNVGTGGLVDVGQPVSTAIFGLFAASHRAETLDIPAPARDGLSLGRKKRLHTGAGIALHKTSGGWVRAKTYDFGRDRFDGKREPLLPVQQTPDTAYAFSGIVQSEITTEAARKVSIEFLPDGGKPMTVLAVVPRIEEVGG